MRKLTTLILAWLVCIMPALAQSGGTIPGGMPQDSTQGLDPNATVLTLTLPGTGLFPNARIFSPSARFVITNNGPLGTYVLELATVPLAYGGTGATTQQGAVNAILGFPSVALGDIAKYNGTNWVRFPIGTASQVLTVNGGGTDFTWSTNGAIPNANAKFILQAVDATMPNAQVLTAGAGITLTPIAGTSETIAIDSTIVTLTGAQQLSNKTEVSPAFTWNAGGGVTLQGSVNNNKLLWADWGASAGNITIPSVNGTTASNVVLDQGTQTLAGTYTFNNAPKLGTNTITSSTGLTITFPNVADTVVNLTSAQGITGQKTITSPILNSSFLLQSTANYTVNWAPTASPLSYQIPNTTVTSTFGMLTGTSPSMAAGKIPYTDGNALALSAVGSSGQPFLSGGAGTPTWGTLLVPGGGTGLTTTTQGDLLVGAAGNTLIKLAKGTANQSLQMDGTGTNVVWGTGGTGTVTSFSSGNLAPLFTTSVATATTTPAQTFALSNAAAYTVFGNNTGGTAAPGYQSLVTQQLPATALVFGGPSLTSLRPLLNVPTGLTVTPTGTLGVASWSYKAVAVDATGTDITAASVQATTTTGNVLLNGSNYNALVCNAVTGAVNYRWYRTASGGTPATLGLIGTTTAPTFTDTGAAGDATTAPTSSTFTGEHWHAGNFSSDAPIIATRLRLSISGNLTISATFPLTVNTELAGGAAAVAGYSPGGGGGGIGGGGGGANVFNGTAGIPGGGGGGGNGGNGGQGGNQNSASFGGAGGQSYNIENQLSGSSGGGGAFSSSAAGGGAGGGGALLIVATGNISINANITSNGADGAAATGANSGGGGGGSGGTVAFYNGGTWTLAASTTISVNGGAGGAGGASPSGPGGGGGCGRVYVRSGGAATNNGTITLTGGAAGATSGGSAATAGSAGVADIVGGVTYSIRSAP